MSPRPIPHTATEAPRPESRDLFSRPVVTVLTIVTSFSLVATVVLALLGPRTEPSAAVPSAHNRTAIGHAALVELLRALDYPVLVSRTRSASKAGPDDLLLLAEPTKLAHGEFEDRLSDAFASARRVLLVLPKWRGIPRLDAPGRLKDVVREGRSAQRIVEIVDAGGRVSFDRRRSGPWSAPTDRSSAFERILGGEAGVAPDLVGAQLLDGSRLEPIVSHAEGVLFGRLPDAEDPGARRFVLTDPDLISNHGLSRGDNAWLAAAVIAGALGPGGTVIVDESFHGASAAESSFEALFRMPLAVASAHLGILLVVLLAARVTRFGAPVPPPPPVERTPGFRIRNTAALLRTGGHDDHVLERYRREVFDEVAAAFHVTGVPRRELAARLDEIAARRAQTRSEAAMSAVDLHERVREFRRAPRAADGSNFLAIARDLHRFREEMLDGTRNRP